MRPAAAAALVLAFAPMLAQPAQAHIPGHAPRSSLDALLRFQEAAYSHARYVCVRGTGEPKRWHCAASQWIGAQVAHTRANLRPAVTGHTSLWMCIHSREGAWNANTGNGFYGGLQMTYGWLGLIAGRASDLSPSAQMAAAERGYRQSGYSTAWLYGQWPNTAPPCT